MARVVYRDENYQNFYVDVNDQQPEVTIGRNTGNMVVIPAKSLSRYHAKIIYQNSHYFLIDLKSSNGSYVNNQRVSQQEIHPGDKLRFGEIVVDFVDDGRGSLAPAGAGLVNGVNMSSSMPMPPAAPMPPQRPMAPPQMPATMSGIAASPGGMPPRAPNPPAAKLAAPKLQMFSPNLSNSSVGPDLRSVSMRPISSGGTYRPTMPNQPAFDEDMAKVAMEQMAAQSAEQSASPIASTMTNGLSPEAAPRTFTPGSMGLRPPVNQRSMVAPPSRAPMPAGPDSAEAPSTFNPGSMGGQRPQERVRMSDLASPVGMNGVANAAAAPLSFNPNGMGPGSAMPVAPTPMQTVARPSGYNNSVAVVTTPSSPSGMPNMMPGMPGMPAQVAPVSMPSGQAFEPVSAEPAIPEPVVPQEVQPQLDNRDVAYSEPEAIQTPDPNPAEAEKNDKNDSIDKLDAIPAASDRRASLGNARRAGRPGMHGRGEAGSSASSSQQSPSVPVASAPVASGYNRAVSGRGMPSGRARFAPRQESSDVASDVSRQVSSGSTPVVQRGSSASIPAVEKIPADEQAVAELDEKVASEVPAADENVSKDIVQSETVEDNANVPMDNVPMDSEAPKSSDEAVSEDVKPDVPVENNVASNEVHVVDDAFQNAPGKSEIIELPDVDSFEEEEKKDEAPLSSVSSAELDKLRGELADVREQLEESQQTVEILNGAMAQLKEHHAGEIDKLKEAHQKEIDELKEAH
ncbi:MAG: FHA domain-containing protein, partial [Proteobacteria bacterium]|nr:FHA domain-containing protein [Pseudomonadota bacterium]